MKNSYGFDPAEVIDVIVSRMREYAADKGGRFVLGINGSKNSLLCAKLAAMAVGSSNVYGTLMPNGSQGDLTAALEVVRVTGIISYAMDIHKAYSALEDQFRYNGLKPSSDTLIDMIPRIRMTALHGVAQTVGGLVLCTNNMSELTLGYFTIFGDAAGGYSPLRDLTAGEVLAVSEILSLPARKAPEDGFQPHDDKGCGGISYADLDRYIRFGESSSEFKAKVLNLYSKNKFKTDIVNVPGPLFGFPDYVKADFAGLSSNIAN